MKKIIALTLIGVLFSANAFAYCIYNKTDRDLYYTVRGAMTGKSIPRNAADCQLTDQRGNYDQSKITLVLEKFWLEGPPRYLDLCMVSVYNKGGYIVATGNKTTGYSCDVYRD